VGHCHIGRQEKTKRNETKAPGSWTSWRFSASHRPLRFNALQPTKCPIPLHPHPPSPNLFCSPQYSTHNATWYRSGWPLSIGLPCTAKPCRLQSLLCLAGLQLASPNTKRTVEPDRNAQRSSNQRRGADSEIPGISPTTSVEKETGRPTAPNRKPPRRIPAAFSPTPKLPPVFHLACLLQKCLKCRLELDILLCAQTCPVPTPTKYSRVTEALSRCTITLCDCTERQL
jgi:hypothetical protein